MRLLAELVYGKFQLSIFYPDGLRKNFDLFSRKIQDFLKQISKFSNSVKNTVYSLLQGIFYQNFRSLAFLQNFQKEFQKFLTPEFSQEISKFQNPKFSQEISKFQN